MQSRRCKLEYIIVKQVERFNRIRFTKTEHLQVVERSGGERKGIFSFLVYSNGIRDHIKIISCALILQIQRKVLFFFSNPKVNLCK